MRQNAKRDRRIGSEDRSSPHTPVARETSPDTDTCVGSWPPLYHWDDSWDRTKPEALESLRSGVLAGLAPLSRANDCPGDISHPGIEEALRASRLKRAASALQTVAVKRELAQRHNWGPAASPHWHLAPISAVAAAWAIAAAQPIDSEGTDWLLQVVNFLRAAQARDDNGDNGVMLLQGLFSSLLADLEAGGGLNWH